MKAAIRRVYWGAWGAVALLAAGCVPVELAVSETELVPEPLSVSAPADAPPVNLDLSGFENLDGIRFHVRECDIHVFKPELAETTQAAMRRAFASRYQLVDEPGPGVTSVALTLNDARADPNCQPTIPFKCQGRVSVTYDFRIEATNGEVFEGQRYVANGDRDGTEHLLCSAIRLEFEKNYRSMFTRFANGVLDLTSDAFPE